VFARNDFFGNLVFSNLSRLWGIMRMTPKTIAILGGGPAGARAGELLARADCRVRIFEEKLEWEKPCGGGVTNKALAEYPFLAETIVERNWIETCELVSPSGRRISLALDRAIAIFSRHTLNTLMRDRAREAGAEIVAQRVTAISGEAGAWQLATREGIRGADFLVIATGARNPFRAQFTQPWHPGDLMTAIGYYIPGTSRVATVRFLPGFEGYFWLFPRADHFSAGICGKLESQTTAQLRVLLEELIVEEGLDYRDSTFYAHILPNLSGASFRNSNFSGEGWAMVGDAAGFVDPVTGEGLHYALRSADLLANALIENHPENYASSVQSDFLPELITAASYAQRFYHGSFCGGALLDRMIQMAAYSEEMRRTLRDLFSGSQGYTDLRQRVTASLPTILKQCGANLLWGNGSTEISSPSPASS
jgi:flavin-dependent dehydrogenase